MFWRFSPIWCCSERWSGMNRISHPDWVKICGDPNGQIKLHAKLRSSFCYRHPFFIDSYPSAKDTVNEFWTLPTGWIYFYLFIYLFIWPFFFLLQKDDIMSSQHDGWFVDTEFLPQNESIFKTKALSKPVIWKRPQVKMNDELDWFGWVSLYGISTLSVI